MNNLPKKSLIFSKIINNESLYYLYTFNYPKEADTNYDKIYKLYLFLKTSENRVSIDSLFNEIADYFSKEDALLRIYLSKYRTKINDESLENVSGNSTTDDSGKIKNGILWTETPSKIGTYKIYKNRKIIKTGNINLKGFQKIFSTYMNNNYINSNN